MVEYAERHPKIKSSVHKFPFVSNFYSFIASARERVGESMFTLNAHDSQAIRDYLVLSAKLQVKKSTSFACVMVASIGFCMHDLYLEYWEVKKYRGSRITQCVAQQKNRRINIGRN